jgi:hypothetical protein
MSQKALTWLILAVVLAVPAVLFYNWLGKMKAQTTPTAEFPRKPESGVAASTDAPTATPFTPSPANAASASTAAAPGGPAAASGQAPAAAPAGQPAAAAVPDAAPVNTTAAAAPAAEPVGTTQAPARKTGEKPIEYAPSTSRDPTFSPLDVKRKLQDAERQRIIEQEKEAQYTEMRQPKKVKKEGPKEPPIEDRIQLYGIISTPNGKAAIVNDGTTYEGDTVMGAVIKRITTNTVVFQYHGKTFTKRVTK